MTTEVSHIVSVRIRTEANRQMVAKMFLPCLLTLGASSAELVLVDNASPNQAAIEEIKDRWLPPLRTTFGQVRLISNSRNRGVTGSYNRAFNQTEGKVVVSHNSDTFFGRKAIDQMVTMLGEHHLAMTGPITNHAWGPQKTSLSPGVCQYQDLERVTEFSDKVYQLGQGQVYPISPGSHLIGFCYALPKQVLVDLAKDKGRKPVLDPRFKTMFSDTDLCWEIMELYGQKSPCLAIALGSFVYHGQPGGGPSPTMAQDRGRNRKTAIDAIRFMLKWKLSPIAFWNFFQTIEAQSRGVNTVDPRIRQLAQQRGVSI